MHFSNYEKSEKVPLITYSISNRHSPWKNVLVFCGFIGFLCLFGVGVWKANSGVDINLLLNSDNGTGSNEFNNTITLDLEIQVNLNQGKLQGKSLTSRAGRSYMAFFGIPYAQPPIGELRFQPPSEAGSWENIRDATYFRNVCVEKERIGDSKLEDQPDVTVGSEDCLYLNVFTPKEPSQLSETSNPFPVMVYFHGGAGGAFGKSQKYRPDYFMDEDVVLITFDYRLGVLGNLNTNTSLASGNQGLKDQVMALQWIQDNIVEFGGDKRKVTIFGNSFGGIQISAHLISPMGQGLYHQAITQSGTLLYPGFFTENPLLDATRLGDLLTCPSNSTNEELTKCLLNATAADLVIQGLELKHKYNYVFTISFDIASEPRNVFLPMGPLESLMAGSLKPIPYLTGIVDAEGLKDSLEVMTDPEILAQFQQNWTNILVPSLYFQLTIQDSKRLEEIATELQTFYLGESNGTETNLGISTFRNFTNMYTDRLYTHPAATIVSFMLQKYNQTASQSTGRYTSTTNNKPEAYFYHFSHKVEDSRADDVQEKYDQNTEYFGECHADELQFFFPLEGFSYIGMDHAYKNFSQMVVRLWVNFANTGIPTGAENNATWIPVDNENPYHYFEINDEPKMINNSDLISRIEFWNRFDLNELYM